MSCILNEIKYTLLFTGCNIVYTANRKKTPGMQWRLENPDPGLWFVFLSIPWSIIYFEGIKALLLEKLRQRCSTGHQTCCCKSAVRLWHRLRMTGR